MAKATNVSIVQQSNESDTLIASWGWTKSYTTGYKVRWWYRTSAGKSILASETTIPYNPRINTGVKDTKGNYIYGSNSTFDMPDDATAAWIHIKPYTDSKKKGAKHVRWTADWSTQVTFQRAGLYPKTPSAPSVYLDYKIASAKYELVCSLANIDAEDVPSGSQVEFYFYRDDKWWTSSKGTVVNRSVSSSKWTDPGHDYKVRCRIIKKYTSGSKSTYLTGNWSDYSGVVRTVPTGVTLSGCSPKTKTSVALSWSSNKLASSYDIEYATKSEYFDKTDMTTVKGGITRTSYEITGLESGNTYYFRVRAANSTGVSTWSSIKSTTLGVKPAAPTTWSSTTTAIVGDPLKLYWVHNSVDGSSQTYAQLELTTVIVNNGIETKDTTTETIANPYINDDDKRDQTSVYDSFNTGTLPNGAKLLWRVRTKGVKDEYGDWSVQRTVDIYAKPSLAIGIIDDDGTQIDTLTSFPFYLTGTTSPSTQTPIGYHVSIVSTEAYETLDGIGDIKYVREGETIYSKNFDISDPLLVEFSASNLSLENNQTYSVVAMASMNSGLTTEDVSLDFLVGWSDDEFSIDAEIVPDSDNLTASVRPYCSDEEGHVDEEESANVIFSVYRREFDGSFTELSLNKTSNEYITDPHPALDYARYRIVGKSISTGKLSYYDTPLYPIQEKAVVLQWDEVARNFEVDDEPVITSEQVWTGSMLKLPYNVDISDNHRPDVELVEYIGRENPVSYYGTQRGSTATWNVEIESDDEETLYQLRRLARWMGDVYVREPSGSGYWAHVVVSFSKKHCALTIPVTLSITRVEGGA